MIQRILRRRRFSIARLDGTITKPSERNEIVSDFQKHGKDVFLLTTQVGGVGLTLTNADRVIIYDPNWNPATDAQAVDRAFRIGQKKDVYIYRLITCGTIEEKIYSRQIFKDSIIKQTTGKHADPTRYFTRSQLRELFILNDPLRSETQEKLSQMHQKHLSKAAEEHIEVLMATNMIYGVSHHDLLFSIEEAKEEVSEDQRRFINQQVERARFICEREADVVAVDLERNPHIVPNLDMTSAAARNRAAAMPSTVNPVDLRDRPLRPLKAEKYGNSGPYVNSGSNNSLPNGTFIDLSQDDFEDHKFSKRVRSTMLESSNEPIIVDDDEDDIQIVKDTRQKSVEITVIDDCSDDDDDAIEDITPHNLTNGCIDLTSSTTTVKPPGSSSRQQSRESSSRESSFGLSSGSPLPRRVTNNNRTNGVNESSDSSPNISYGGTRKFVIASDEEDHVETVAMATAHVPANKNKELECQADTRPVVMASGTSLYEEAEASGFKDNNAPVVVTSVDSVSDKDEGSTSKADTGHVTTATGNSLGEKIEVSGSKANENSEDPLAVLPRRSDPTANRLKDNKQRRSVAVIGRKPSESPEPIEFAEHNDPTRSISPNEGNKVQDVEDQKARLRAAEEAAYDMAFEDDEVDEGLIEKTILESSLPLSDSMTAHEQENSAEAGHSSMIEMGESASQAMGYQEDEASMIVEDSSVEIDEDQIIGRKSPMAQNDVTMDDVDGMSVIEDSDEDL